MHSNDNTTNKSGQLNPGVYELGASSIPVALAFRTDLTGWVVTRGRETGGPQLFRTDDGAKTWIAVDNTGTKHVFGTYALRIPQGSADVVELAVSDPTGVSLRTVSKDGIKVEAIARAEEIRAWSFASVGDTWWMLGREDVCSIRKESCEEVSFEVTLDARVIRRVDAARGALDRPIDSLGWTDVGAIHFYDTLRGLAGGETVSDAHMPMVLSTMDGGDSWQRGELPESLTDGRITAVVRPMSRRAGRRSTLWAVQARVFFKRPTGVSIGRTYSTRSPLDMWGVPGEPKPIGDYPVRDVWRMALYAVLVTIAGCGNGGGSGNDNRAVDPTSTPTPPLTPTPIASSTPTPQTTPVSAANAWSVGARVEAGGPDVPGREDGLILRSTDAGAHWTPTLTVADALFEGVSFADASRGWVVGSGEILRSDDGGLTWASQRTAVPLSRFSLEAVQALSRDTVVAVGGGEPLQGTGDAPSSILRTEDAGTTWTVLPISPGGGGDPTRTRLQSVCITPAGTGLAVGTGTTSRLVARTADHGASWADITARVASSTGGEFFDVTCLDDEFWITTDGATFVTYSADGGGNWHSVVVPHDVAGLTGISAPARGVAIAVGVDATNHPLIIRTSDAGLTWTRQPIDGSVGEGGLNDVSFAGDSGTAVGGPQDLSATGSVTAISQTQGLNWTAGDSLEGRVSLHDVARLP